MAIVLFLKDSTSSSAWLQECTVWTCLVPEQRERERKKKIYIYIYIYIYIHISENDTELHQKFYMQQVILMG